MVIVIKIERYTIEFVILILQKIINFKPKYSLKKAIEETIKENKNFKNWE